jgi:FkbM family methyltransferase
MSDPAWWRTFIPDQAIVYDIGANVGDTVREFAPRAKWVYAFEPNPHCFEVLRRTTLDLPNVRLFDFCLSNTIGGDRVFTYRHWLLLPTDPADPRLENRNYHPGQRTDLKGEFPVFYTTLDQVVNVIEAPDFMKIDVDGMEYAVLDGAREMLRVDQPILYLEIGVQDIAQHGDNATDLVTLLSACGYAFVIDSYGSPLRATAWMLLAFADGFDHNCNVLCVPRGDPRLDQWEAPPPDGA